MRTLRRLFFKLFPTYRRLELRVCSWDEADKLIKAADGTGAENEWHIAKEDEGMSFPMVALERRRRIVE
jgi:hypothetical protein